jgi:hypothetical protein
MTYKHLCPPGVSANFSGYSIERTATRAANERESASAKKINGLDDGVASETIKFRSASVKNALCAPLAPIKSVEAKVYP